MAREHVATDIVEAVRRAAGHLKEVSDSLTSAASDCLTTGVDQGTRDTLEFAHQQAAHMKREVLRALELAKGNRASGDLAQSRPIRGLGMAVDGDPIHHVDGAPGDHDALDLASGVEFVANEPQDANAAAQEGEYDGPLFGDDAQRAAEIEEEETDGNGSETGDADAVRESSPAEEEPRE